LDVQWGAYKPDYWQNLLIAACRHSPLGRGKARRFIRDKLLKKDPAFVDYSFPFACMRIRLTGNACEWKLLLNPKYNHEELSFIKKRLQRTPPGQRIFVDIGANIGVYSLQVYTDCDIILAVEPLPKARESLNYNISVNRYNGRIRVLPFAVSDTNCEMELLCDNNDLGGASLISKKNESTVTVQARTLYTIVQDNRLPCITCLKIDIEGHEDRALLPYLEKSPAVMHPESIVIEHLSRNSWKTDCIEYLVERNYRLVDATRNNSMLVLDKS